MVRRKPTPAPVVVEDDEVEEIEELVEEDDAVEELEDDESGDDEDIEELVEGDEAEDDVEELEEEPEPEAVQPKKKAAKPAAAKATPAKKAAEAPEFDSNWLAEHVNKITGSTYDARGIRMLLRKLAKDGKLARTIGEDRGRYSFSGVNDPIVKAIVTMVKSGAADELKKESLQAMKDKVAANKAAEAPAPPAKKAAPAKAAPAKATTKAAPAKAAPAKATTTRRTRPAAK